AHRAAGGRGRGAAAGFRQPGRAGRRPGQGGRRAGGDDRGELTGGDPAGPRRLLPLPRHDDRAGPAAAADLAVGRHDDRRRRRGHHRVRREAGPGVEGRLMTAPAAVTVCECWARDGLQSWPCVVPTEAKLAVLRAAIDAGVTEVDATSLVPPKYAPQFADSHDVLAALACTGV